MLVSRVNTANIDLFPLNGDVICLENGLDGLRNFHTNTVTYYSSRLAVSLDGASGQREQGNNGKKK